MQVRIGSLVLENPLFLAPMAGVTDLPFRKICRQEGAALATTEMVSATGLVLGAKNTKRLLASDETDRPLCVQLFGSDPEIMARAARICQDEGADIVDINMGCPVAKVVRRGAGAALLRDPVEAGYVIRSVRKSLEIPLTIKMRSGWTTGKVVAFELARIAQEYGVDAITLHPRARSQGYETSAKWELIQQLQESITVPVIGNGDALTPQDTLAMRVQTGCKAVMIGRGARGNPWIFSRALAMMRGEPVPPPPGLDELERVIRTHLEAIESFYGEKKALHAAKSHIFKYLKGLPTGAKIRAQACRATDFSSLISVITSQLERLGTRYDHKGGHEVMD